VRPTTSVRVSAERNRQTPVSVTSRQSRVSEQRTADRLQKSCAHIRLELRPKLVKLSALVVNQPLKVTGDDGL